MSRFVRDRHQAHAEGDADEQQRELHPVFCFQLLGAVREVERSPRRRRKRNSGRNRAKPSFATMPGEEADRKRLAQRRPSRPAPMRQAEQRDDEREEARGADSGIDDIQRERAIMRSATSVSLGGEELQVHMISEATFILIRVKDGQQLGDRRTHQVSASASG